MTTRSTAAASLLVGAACLALTACGRSSGGAPQRVDTTLPDANATTTPATATNSDSPAEPSTDTAPSNTTDPTTAPPAADQQAPPEATNTPAAAHEITQPDWLRKPSGEDVARYYPDRAQRMNIEGYAAISCTVTEQGTLSGCSVTNEEPSDAGFGDAAMRMSRLFKMQPMARDGSPVAGGVVRIPIAFRLPRG